MPSDGVIPLMGGPEDLVPMETMDADAGAGWVLYTADQLVSHSRGFVSSPSTRELIIFTVCKITR